MLRTEFTGQFKKDYRQALKRGHNPDKLWEIVTMLAEEKPLPEKCKDHDNFMSILGKCCCKVENCCAIKQKYALNIK